MRGVLVDKKHDIASLVDEIGVEKVALILPAFVGYLLLLSLGSVLLLDSRGQGLYTPSDGHLILLKVRIHLVERPLIDSFGLHILTLPSFPR